MRAKALAVRSGMQEEQYRLVDVTGLLVWKRKRFGMSTLFGAVGGIATWGIGEVMSDDTSTVTGSPGGDIAVAAAIGALCGMMEHAMDPGTWHRIY